MRHLIRTTGRALFRPIAKASVAGLLAVACVAGQASSGHAIVNGSNDVNTTTANAVVNLNGCTGTLISTDEVLTAGHCVETNRPNGAAYTNAKGFTYSGGSTYVLGSDGRLWAHTVRAPFAGPYTSGTWGPYLAMAPLNTTEAFGFVSGGHIEAVNVTTRAVRSLGIAPTPFVALAHADRYYAVSGMGRLYSAASPGGPWQDIGTAPGIISMTERNGVLYGVTSTRLLMRRTGTSSIPWTDIGHANGAKEITRFGNRLLLMDTSTNAWTRSAVPYEENWQEFGHMPEAYDGMTIVGNTFIGSNSRRALATADVSPSPRNIGTGLTNATRLTATNGAFYATTSTGLIMRRMINNYTGAWTTFSLMPTGTVGLSGDEAGQLWAATSDRKLYKRSITTNSPWQLVPGQTPAGIVALGVNGPGSRFVAFTNTGRTMARVNLGILGIVWLDTGAWDFNLARGLAAGPERMYGFSALGGGGSVWVSRYDKPLFRDVPEFFVAAGEWTSFASQGTGVTANFGAQQSAWTAIVGREFQFAGDTDIAIVRLAQSVPSSVATPSRVQSTAPALSSFTAYAIVGWGDTGGGSFPTTRRLGSVVGGLTIPEVSGPLTQFHRFVLPVSGSEAYGLQGDSGGPAFITVGGVRFLIGVFNQGGPPGYYQAVWVGSTTDNLDRAHPNTKEWIRRAII